MEKLDKKDFKILYELDFNARMPITKLAKKVGLSPQLTKYRLKKLTGKGVIRGFLALIDIHKLGYYSYRIYLRLQKVSSDDHSKIIKFFNIMLPSVWVVSTSGRWDVEIVLLARNPVDFNNILRKIKGKLGEQLKNYSISPSIFNYHFKRTYLIEAKREIVPEAFVYGFEYEPYKLDEINVRILNLLSKNARMGNKDIGKAVGLSDGAVKERIKKLEKDGIIQSYRIFIDIDKIGKKFYKAMATAKALSEEHEKVIYSFSASRSEVTYFVGCFGEWDFEIETEVNDEADFRKLMNEFMNQFGDVAGDYEVLHVYEQYKMDYFPIADRLLKKMK